MSGPAGCEVVGRWRIVASDLWDRDYLDLVAPAYFQIGAEGWAEFSFGAVDATAELEYGRRIIFFHSSGFDERDADQRRRIGPTTSRWLSLNRVVLRWR